jgi:hypothetical protein
LFNAIDRYKCVWNKLFHFWILKSDNMKNIKILIFLLFAALHTSAQIQFTAGINYESGVPSGAPSSTGSRLRVDLASGRIYQWSAANTTWRTLGQGIDIVAGCAAPAYTPGYAQSVFAVNGCSTPELYYYNGTEWKQVAGGGGGGGTTYYAGTGIDIDANDTISIDTVPRLIFYSDQTYSGGVGAMRWNNDDGTLDLGLKGGNVTLQLGQELVQPVKHATNGGLDNGKVVYITGSSGDNKTVLYARANNEATSTNTLGLMTETVTGGNKGFCTTFGLVRNINTSNLTEGGAVWLSKDTAGAMTAVRPEAPNHGVFIGFCVRKHASTGVIFVNVQNGYELEELHNVYAPSPTNGQVLTYVSANSRWEAATVADQSATNELQTIDQFSLSGQTLSASLSSDGVSPSTVTLPVVNVTAGTNISVTSSSGNYTINNTGAAALSGVTGYVPQFNSATTIDTTGLFWGNGSRLGIGTEAPGASLQINGEGITSGTSALLLNNATPSELFRVANNGLISVGKNVSVSTQSSSQIQAVSGDAATNIVLTPKGTGAITVGSAPDGTITGGSARGANAIDLQFTRATSSTIVASGDRSALIGGNNNLASAQFSFVGGGGSNSSTGTNAAILGGAINTASAENSSAFGRRALANLYGSQAFSTFGFAVAGDGMTLRFSVQREITGTAASELTLTGAAPASTTRAILVSNRLWNVNLQVSAICSTAGNGTLTLGDSYVATYQVGIKRLVNTTTLVGTPQLISTQSDTGMSTSAVTISADDATGNESLKVEFTPPTATAGSTTVIRVIVAATATVVGY